MNRAALEKMLADGKDNALLRFSLGTLCAKDADTPDHATAVDHFERALAFNPAYSAAYKALGASLVALGRASEAAATYRSGIEAANSAGDMQAAREMGVFLKRLEK